MGATAGSFLGVGAGGQRVGRLGRDLLKGTEGTWGQGPCRTKPSRGWFCLLLDEAASLPLSFRHSAPEGPWRAEQENPVSGWGGSGCLSRQSLALGSGKSHFWEAGILDSGNDLDRRGLNITQLGKSVCHSMNDATFWKGRGLFIPLLEVHSKELNPESRNSFVHRHVH